MTPKTLRGALYLAGFIIGAGFFGLPFAAREAGFFVTLTFLVLGLGLVILIHLAFGEIVLRTKEEYGFFGYVEKYLGRDMRNFAIISGMAGILGTLLVYIILGSNFISILIPFVSIKQSIFILSLLGLVILQRGLWFSSKVEVGGTVLLVVVLILLSLISFSHFEPQHLIRGSFSSIFLPYGIALFSLIGSSAIPDLVKIFSRQRGSIRPAIILGSLIPFLLYIVFTLAVLGATGSRTTPDAIGGLNQEFGPLVAKLGALVGLFAIFTSYLVLGLYFRRVLIHDFKFPRLLSTFLPILLPLSLYFLGVQSFILVVGVVGAVGGGVDAVILFLTHRRAQKKGDIEPPYALRIPVWALSLLIFLFVGGAVAELIYVLS